MAKLPIISGEHLIRALKHAGFSVVRQKGSHVSFNRKNVEGREYRTVVPLHKELARGTLSDILN